MEKPCTECGRLTDSDPDYCWPGKCAGCSNKGPDKDARIAELEAALMAEKIEVSRLIRSATALSDKLAAAREELSALKAYCGDDLYKSDYRTTADMRADLAAKGAECERLRDAMRLAMTQLEVVEDGEHLTGCGANAIAVLRTALEGDFDSVGWLRDALRARDERRVERVAKVLCHHDKDCKEAQYECPCQYWGEQAREALAAADEVKP